MFCNSFLAFSPEFNLIKITFTFLAKNIANRSYTIRPAKLEAPANYTLQLKVDF